MAYKTYIALGTNIGDRLENFQTAIEELPAEINTLRASRVYETPPWGYTDQRSFYNMVLEAETTLNPKKLLASLKAIEARMGRGSSFRNAPRVIDLDILFIDNLVLQDGSLAVPHPRMQGRGFVLVPLADLAPDFIHPVFGISVAEMLAQADTSGIKMLDESPEIVN
jgi:2-amino-4-hydroxy-6-hydroxymethyldihydropteridine diphosphokinase